MKLKLLHKQINNMRFFYFIICQIKNNPFSIFLLLRYIEQVQIILAESVFLFEFNMRAGQKKNFIL